MVQGYDHKASQKKKVSVLIYILFLWPWLDFSVLLFFFLKKPVVKPPVNYTFKTAPKNSGYVLLNDNKESANFTVQLGKSNAAFVPAARFEVKDASVDFSLADSQGKTGPSVIARSEATRQSQDVVVWQNILPSTDVRYKILPDGLKEEFIIKDKSQAVKALKGHERYTFPFL